MLFDNALAFDPVSARCDMVFDGQDLALDTTPQTPLLIAVGCSRRARPDDTLPTGTTDLYSPSSLMARQGWPGDAFDPNGERIGSRFWLVEGAKDAPPTYRLAADALAEATGFFKQLGYAVGVKTVRVRAGVLGAVVAVEGSEVELRAVMA